MGLFDWLMGTSRQTVKLREMIWLTKKAKFEGIVHSMDAPSLVRPDTIILVSHFADTHELLQLIADKTEDRHDVHTVMARELPELWQPLIRDESTFLRLIVGERHPHAARDAEIFDLVQQHANRCDVIYHVALEDALMKAFAGAWVESSLRGLGMTEDEAIESKMVSRRIIDAQKKIAAQCQGEIDANSAEEWMERNCPQLVKR